MSVHSRRTSTIDHALLILHALYRDAVLVQLIEEHGMSRYATAHVFVE